MQKAGWHFVSSYTLSSCARPNARLWGKWTISIVLWLKVCKLLHNQFNQKDFMKLVKVLLGWGGNIVGFQSSWLWLTVFHGGLTCILMRSHSAHHKTNEQPGRVALVSGLWQARGDGSVWFAAQQLLPQPHTFSATCLFLSISFHSSRSKWICFFSVL